MSIELIKDFPFTKDMQKNLSKKIDNDIKELIKKSTSGDENDI